MALRGAQQGLSILHRNGCICSPSSLNLNLDPYVGLVNVMVSHMVHIPYTVDTERDFSYFGDVL